MDNLTFYLLEFMPKPTETSKKSQIFGKNCTQIKFLGKNTKTSKFSEKIAKISKFLEQTLNFWNKMQKSQDFG